MNNSPHSSQRKLPCPETRCSIVNVALLDCSCFHVGPLMQRSDVCVLSAEAEQVFASRSLRHSSRSNNGRMIPRSTPYDSRRKSRFRNQCTEQPTAYRSGPFLLVRHPRSRSDRLNASLNASKGRDEDWANRFSQDCSPQTQASGAQLSVGDWTLTNT
jgi:hypothetical protein